MPQRNGALVRQGSPLSSPGGAGSRELEGFARKQPTGATGLLGEGQRPLRRTARDSALCFSPTKLDKQSATNHQKRKCLLVTVAVKSRTETDNVKSGH